MNESSHVSDRKASPGGQREIRETGIPSAGTAFSFAC